MMNEIQNNLRDIAEMNGEDKYTDKVFIQTAYLKIAGTHQFVKQCDRWKTKAPDDRKTEVQFREFWTKEYKLWHKKQHSLQQLGIANSVQSQQTIQDLQREVAEAKEEARIAMSLATQQKEEATVATANSTISSITEAITAATNNSKQPSNNDVVSTQLQTLIDLIKNQTKENKNQRNYTQSWKNKPPKDTDQTMDTPEGKVFWKTNTQGRKYYWCDKCKRYTPTHNSHTHKDKK